MAVERQTYPVAGEPLEDHRFDVATLLADSSWKVAASDRLLRERVRLTEWAAEQKDPAASYHNGAVDLPEVTALAEDIKAQLDRLNKMSSGSMKPDLKKWLNQRINILKQL